MRLARLEIRGFDSAVAPVFMTSTGLVVDGCVFADNVGTHSGGVYVSNANGGGALTVVDSLFESGAGGRWGGARGA